MTGCLLAAVFLLFARGAQAQQYAALTAGASVTRTLAADETVTLVYDSRAATDSGERYMLVELTYEAEGDSYPDPLLMVAFERVPFIFYHAHGRLRSCLRGWRRRLRARRYAPPWRECPASRLPLCSGPVDCAPPRCAPAKLRWT